MNDCKIFKTWSNEFILTVEKHLNDNLPRKVVLPDNARLHPANGPALEDSKHITCKFLENSLNNEGGHFNLELM